MMYGDAVGTAIKLLFSADPGLWRIVGTSLAISLTATFIAALTAIPAGYLIASATFPGRRVLIVLLNTLLSIPTVVIGLILYGLLSRSGPMGDAGLLYSRWAIILGESILIFPIVCAYTLASVTSIDPRLRKTAKALGAAGWTEGLMVVSESRFGIAASVVAGFGRAIGEVGIAMMLGGNIAGFTRTITTAIALEHNKGNFALGLALGLVLFVLALGLNALFHVVQGAGKRA